MIDGLRKVVHVEVFDFDEDTMAYAVESHKNQFGYRYTTEYIKKGKVVKTIPEINNVERGAFFYRTFKINLDQQKSLRRMIRRLKKDKAMLPFPLEDGGVEAIIRGGTSITYRGKNTEDFYQKVLRIK